MKKLFTLLEDLWVVIAFAEEGIYESAVMQNPQPTGPDTVSVAVF